MLPQLKRASCPEHSPQETPTPQPPHHCDLDSWVIRQLSTRILSTITCLDLSSFCPSKINRNGNTGTRDYQTLDLWGKTISPEFHLIHPKIFSKYLFVYS